MNLIILDIDEVLCTHRSRAGVIGLNRREDPNWMHALDGTAVGMIVNLALEHDAAIVICSTWRKNMSREEIVARFSVHYADFGSLLAPDWATDEDGPRRSDELDRYLAKNGHLYSRVVVIDDDTCERYEHIQVKPNQLDGLSVKDYLAAKELLST